MITPDVHARFSLDGRIAVVTGAGSGIGAASARVLAGAGATVACLDIDATAAQATASAISESGGAAEYHRVDVSDRSDIGRVVDDVVARHERIDVMANVAGIMLESPILDLDGADVDRIMAVNLKGTLNGCQAAGRHMVAQGSGSIINMSSSAVLTPTANIGAYAMTKAAVVQLTRTLAVEIAKKGVRVNALAPGFILTSMTGRYFVRPDGTVDEEMKAAVLTPMAKFTPLRRIGEPDDIAYSVLFLASDASSFVTGQLFAPNGGAGMH